MTRYKWPESVPVLTATDIGYGECELPRRDLWGWIGTYFYGPCHGGGPRGQVFRALYRQIKEHDKCVSIAVGLSQAPSRRTRGKTITKSDIADIWNAAMRSLGYTEIEEVDDEHDS